MHHVCTVSLMLTSTALLMGLCNSHDIQESWRLDSRPEALRDLTVRANVSIVWSFTKSITTAAPTAAGGLAGWILDRQYLRERLWIPLCLWATLWRQWGAEQLAAFDSGVLSSENMGQRYGMSIWVSETLPAIWAQSGAISSYTIDQNLDRILLGWLYF